MKLTSFSYLKKFMYLILKTIKKIKKQLKLITMQNKGYISRMTFSILTNNKEARDNWMLVVKQVHDIEMMYWGISKAEYYDALFSFKLTNPQTISRIWRKIQEHNPELRGDEWEQRQQQGGQIAQEIVMEKEKFQQIPLF